MDTLKIAYVKSINYQDLWIHDITNDPFTLLKTTMMRIPPLSFAENFNTDFIIINDPSNESNEFEKFGFDPYSNTNKLPSLPFLYNEYHSHTNIINISHSANDINWEQYNIVICMNMCISSDVIKKFPKILWCYFIGENFNNDDRFMLYVHHTYDIFLNQQVNLRHTFSANVIGFPYTFLHPNSLTNINKKYLNNNNNNKKHGIFLEINTTTERPVKTIPPEFIKISEVTSEPIILHQQDILKNITNLYKSKYFVKLFGREIRGNSVLEAISSGSLVLINKDLIMYSELIHDNCNVKTSQDVINIINTLNNNNTLYEELLSNQYNIMLQYYHNEPIKKLYDQYLKKQEQLNINDIN
jgi:hypothetical protein